MNDKLPISGLTNSSRERTLADIDVWVAQYVEREIARGSSPLLAEIDGQVIGDILRNAM